jgi:glyoxylase-like metal-dependent hydrolase (beta-lactamase superfamily II)
VPEGPTTLAQRLADGTWLLDTRFEGRHATVGVYLVPQRGAAGRAGRFDLVESGPASTVPRLLDAIAAAGYHPEGLESVLVTHVHLDHAGAAGALAERFGARVIAFERGAPHLVDPTRLLASARRVYGDALATRWGLMVPVRPERMVAVTDGDVVEVGGHDVRVVHTPGHATHHAAFLWPDGACYVGDAAGVRVPGSRVVRPALPPPEVDLESWDASLRKLREASPRVLRLTHFGEVDAVEAHLRAVSGRNHEWAEAVLAWVAEGLDEAALSARVDALARDELRVEGADEATIERHLATSDASMTVAGVVRYWRTLHPQRWEAATGG